jgi:hypothetical protein
MMKVITWCRHMKNFTLKTYLLLMFADKYPNLKLSYDIFKRRFDEYIHHKPKQSNSIRKKIPEIYNNLEENNKLDCFYGQKSGRFVKMHKKEYFQINKENILEILKVRKESAVKKIRVSKPYYYNKFGNVDELNLLVNRIPNKVNILVV